MTEILGRRPPVGMAGKLALAAGTGEVTVLELALTLAEMLEEDKVDGKV